MRLNWTWRIVIGAAVLTVVVVVVLVANQHRVARSLASPNSPPPSPLNEINAFATYRGEPLNAPPYSRVYLGPGTRTVYFRKNVSIEGGYVTSDGLLYVNILNNYAGSTEYWSLALLSAGRIQPIPMPGHSGYSSIDFSEASTAESPVVSASAYDGHEYLS